MSHRLFPDRLAGDETMPNAITMFRWTLRLFGAGLASLIVVAVLESWIGSLPSFLGFLYRLYLLVGMILIPAVVLSAYVVTVFGIAIYALWKVLRTNWRLRA
jgi:hypothetical protein